MENAKSVDRPSNIKEIEGDLFDAPNGAALIPVFKAKYPAAFKIYQSHCRRLNASAEYNNVSTTHDNSGNEGSTRLRLPEGTALIIPPQEKDYVGKANVKKHWIICLFTSRKTGKSVSPPETILRNTELAVTDMKSQLRQLQSERGSQEIPISALWSCRFNSGLFKVDWELSRNVLEKTGLDVTVVRPEGEN
ncbi:ADP-ribose 1''-phosphate phosphatase [Aspergillus tanneri]|uniref:ADP-ribose 1''-phosphate phosphatase n=1 Tax=Aspergillus tanneri TaxID=1220188 RepID=A0A5M9MZK9_9EURO|nr:ADP-ribose 1''-phosphate phosphatase [Aspergillus tanneri]KAA8651426.1 ADP-ribose 1''-phosphate phosphatase [Aspergillus tanneri]